MAEKKNKKEIELEVKARIDHVTDLLNKKTSRQDICTSTIKKFNVTEKQVDIYIKEAKEAVIDDKKDIDIDTRKNKKADEMESRKRITKIIEMLLDCEPRHKICQYMSKKWELTDRQIDRYIRKAKNKIIQNVRKEDKNAYENAIARRERLFNKAVKKKSLKTALNIDDSKAKIQGLFTENLKLSADKDNPIEIVIKQMTDEQLKKIKETQDLVKDVGNND